VLVGVVLLGVALLWLAGLVPDTSDQPDVVNDSLALIAASLFPLAAGIDLLRHAARRPRSAARQGTAAG